MSDFELRLAALSKLVTAKSDAVDQRLSEEFSRASTALLESTEYEELSQALKTLTVLIPRFHAALLEVLEKFVNTLVARTLTDGGEPISEANLRYQSPANLICDAIGIADRMRYIHTEWEIKFLLDMSRNAEKEVSDRARRAFEALAKFDLDVFYGPPARGAHPQSLMVAEFSCLEDAVLRSNSGVILETLSIVLSPTIEGTSWTYNSIAIRRGSVGSDGGVAEMRASAIELLMRMYVLDSSVDYRKQVLDALNSATRREASISDSQTSAMFERDAIGVLEFMRNLVPGEALPIVQTIEHQAYWDYFHAPSQAVKDMALQVRDMLDAHLEYQVFKQLIGFEGIFGRWEDLSRSDDAWDYSDTKRRETARSYLDEINEASFGAWRDRILEYSKTRSNDLATFPVYYEFLESVGRERPHLALELIVDHEDAMEPFLIALVRGLWASTSAAEIEAIARRWIAEGRHLSIVAKSLYQVGASKLDMLTAMVDRAASLDDRNTLMEVMGVAASLAAEGATDAMPVFLQSLRELGNRNDARWANIIWFRRDLRVLVDVMEPNERSEMLSALLAIPEVDHQVEVILCAIAQQDVESVIAYFINRLIRAREISEGKRESTSAGRSGGDYEPIPYQLSKLGAILARAPEALLSSLRSDFDKELRGLFAFRGARLLISAFPSIANPLEEMLMRYVKSGGDSDIDFVIDILRAYRGAASVLDICKAIIRAVPERSRTWNDVASIIETTGVVTGEYGMAEAFERKVQEISSWKEDHHERVREFAELLIEELRHQIEHERKKADEELALRKYRYGNSSGEG